MALELYGLLGDEAPDLTLDTLAADLRKFFARTEGFHLEREDDPFDPSLKNLLLTWGSWWTRVFYDVGPDVAAASSEIAELAGEDGKAKISQIDRRIRVLFADDVDRVYTNHVIFMMDFLGSIPGVKVFDPHQQTFV
jgi:hypothetical protein